MCVSVCALDKALLHKKRKIQQVLESIQSENQILIPVIDETLLQLKTSSSELS